MKLPYRRKAQQEAELGEEIQSHLQMAASDRKERGESAERAQHYARREFGNVSLVEQVTRDQWGWHWLEDLLQNLGDVGAGLRPKSWVYDHRRFDTGAGHRRKHCAVLRRQWCSAQSIALSASRTARYYPREQ